MKLKHAYILCLLVFVLLCFFLPPAGFFDTHFWHSWALQMKVTGLGHAYTIPTLNYNPLYLYVIRAYSAMYSTSNQLLANISLLKVFTLLFDVGAIVLLMHWVSKHGGRFFLAFFVLLNIGYLYNTLFWGQIDAIHTTFIFAAFVAAFEQRLGLSVLLFLLALNTKTQSILFTPLLGMLWLPLAKGRLRAVLAAIAMVVLLQVLILMPFIMNGTTQQVWHNLTGVVDYNPFVSMHAYNFWYLFMWENNEVPRDTVDTLMVGPLSYKNWGFVLFCLGSFIALLPMFLSMLVKLFKQERFTFDDAPNFFLSAMLIAILFFYFPTQMHERYSHPAILFSGVYFVLTRRWWLLLPISYAYLMNLESLDKCFKLQNYHTLIFDARLIAGLYTFALVAGVFMLYKEATLRHDFNYLKSRLFSRVDS